MSPGQFLLGQMGFHYIVYFVHGPQYEQIWTSEEDPEGSWLGDALILGLCFHRHSR